MVDIPVPAERVALKLAPVPALCLLTGIGWLVYLVIRGEPATSTRPVAFAAEPRQAHVNAIRALE